MNNIVDLNKEREISALINKLGSLISADPDLNERTFEYLNGDTAMVDTDKTKTVSVRFPIELLKWIDIYVRAISYNSDERFTRNQVIISFLETMRGIIAHREKTEWDASHLEMIKEAIDDAATCREANKKAMESGNQSTGGDEG